ncbi:MAG: prepilin peptidase [Chloroflexi bacterium]|nr:prepilin peptidase [Chloroflexota bacterium]
MTLIELIKCVLIGFTEGIIINYVADVMPRSRRLVRPLCPNCQKAYTFYQYLFSFKCQNCGNKSSIRHLIVLIVSILCSIAVFLFPLNSINYFATIPIFLFLGSILVIDIEHRVVLIETSLVGLILFFVYGIYQNGFIFTLLGGVSGFLLMLLIYFFGILFSKGLGKIRKQEIEEVALGLGDVYTCGFLGLLTGYPLIIGSILLAIIASGIFSFFYISIKLLFKDYHAFTAIPYTPFLIAGAVATFYIRIS